jgi:diguanylate cyclase (GGDEF)-like protein
MSPELSTQGIGLGGGMLAGIVIGFVFAWFWRGATAAARPWDLVERRTVGVVRHLFEVTHGVIGRLHGLSDRFEATVIEQRRAGNADLASIAWMGAESRAVSQYLEQTCSQLEAQIESLQSQARLLQADVSTGLANRDAFLGLLKQRLTLPVNDARPTSVATLEIDGLGQIVSQYGRKTAERVARQISEALVETLRAKDVLARIDEHQFAMLLPDTRLADAQLAAERLRRAITTRVTQVEKRAITPTVSLGLTMALPTDDAQHLLGRAQQAVEAARVAGGNSVQIHDGTRCQPLDETVLPVTRPQTYDLHAMPKPDMLAPQLAAMGVDPATGLPNRQTLLDTLRDRYAQCAQGSGTLSLMLVQIDELPLVHRQHGAQTGDALLRVITQLIRSTTRASFDHLGLYEHNTIGVLLVDASLQDALNGAERLHRALVNCRLRDDGRDLTLTSTIGVAQLPVGGDSLALMDAAGRALETARRGESAIGFVDNTGAHVRGSQVATV